MHVPILYKAVIKVSVICIVFSYVVRYSLGKIIGLY
jgi:hypothetical protein